MKKKKFGDIEEAKKIKSRYKQLEYIYDNSCKKIDDLHKGENICDFKCNQCRIQQLSNSKEINGCCRTCRLQSKNGCISSNLTCKLFYCDEVKKKYTVYTFDDLELLKLLSRRQKFMLKYELFASREEVLLDLFFGSVLLSAFRQVYMVYKNCFYLLFKNKAKNFYGKIVVIMTLFFTLMALLLMPEFLIIIFLVGFIDDIIVWLIKRSK